jgi:histone chaperone ASF1
VGYYVNNEYDSEELNAEPPAKPLLDRVRRNVLAEKPRVTRFAIKWWVKDTSHSLTTPTNFHRDSEASAPAEFPPEQPEADLVEADGEEYGAEEADEEEEELAEGAEGATEANGDAMVEDQEMAGAESAAAAAEEEEASGDESEDLEAESSGSEDEEGEEEEEGEGEGEGEEAMEVDDVEKPANGIAHQADTVMAHWDDTLHTACREKWGAAVHEI